MNIIEKIINNDKYIFIDEYIFSDGVFHKFTGVNKSIYYELIDNELRLVKNKKIIKKIEHNIKKFSLKDLI